MKNLSALVLLIVTWFCSGLSYSQETDTAKSEQWYLITRLDGTEYVGIILQDDGREVLIETETLGKIYISKSEIKSIVKIEEKKEIRWVDYRASGPFTTRYCFTTNALPVVEGENYALINLHGPEVHIAATNRFTIGAMTTWFASPAILAMKYSLKTKDKNVNLSFGTLLGSSGYMNLFRGFGGIHFANVTLGHTMKNLTISSGYAYIRTGFYGSGNKYASVYFDNKPYSSNDYLQPLVHGPVFSVAGMISAGSKASFVFDSMVGIFNSKDYTAVTTVITPESYNQNPPYEWIPGWYRHDVTVTKTLAVAMFLMPGVRFQTTEKQAFQVALAGVSVFRTKGYVGTKPNFSFPVPMCTWFFKF